VSSEEAPVEKAMRSCYYFGCQGQAGHHLWTEGGGRLFDHNVPKDFPVRVAALDCGFLPPNRPQVEGEASLAHVEGWTILAFWDRSVDTRPGCNNAFVLPLLLSFDEAKQLARERFPSVWDRFKFEVVRRT